jgi:hypothetical protein
VSFPFLGVISVLWIVVCHSMFFAICLRCVCGRVIVLCLDVASFYIRILFHCLCVVFELVLVFSWPHCYMLVCLFAHNLVSISSLDRFG